jgi:hypothetical protein
MRSFLPGQEYAVILLKGLPGIDPSRDMLLVALGAGLYVLMLIGLARIRGV